MTRDARLSALHRGGFWPGAALPSPALPPDPYSELLAARSSCLAGGVPDLPSPRLRAAAAGRHSPLRLQDRLRKTPLHERGWQNVLYIRYVVKKYLRYVVVIPAPCEPTARGMPISLAASASAGSASAHETNVAVVYGPRFSGRSHQDSSSSNHEGRYSSRRATGPRASWHVHGAPGGNHTRASFSS